MKIHHNKDIEVISFLDERYYTEGEEVFYPATQTILEVYPKGYAFQNFLKQVGMNVDEIVKKASEQGAKMHDTFHKIMDGYTIAWIDDLTGRPAYTLEEWLMVAKFFEFIRDYQPEVVAKKHKIISDKIGVGDTIDLVCEISGQLWLIDYKSGNYIYETDYMRLAVCVELWNENNQRKIEKAGILHLKAETRGQDKKGKKIQGEGWQLKEPTEPLDKYFEIFGHVKAIWHSVNPNPKPKSMQYPDKFSLQDLTNEVAVGNTLNDFL
jgi:hypothetical protein